MSELALLGGDRVVSLKEPVWPQIGKPEVAALNEAFEASQDDSTYFNSMSGEGPIAEFEARMERYLDCAHAVATGSCAAALQMALYAAGVGAGDEVVALSIYLGADGFTDPSSACDADFCGYR